MNSISPISKILSDEAVGGEVTVRGWVYRKRSSGKLLFIVVRDSTDIVQCAIKADKVSEKAFKEAESTLIESAVTISGVVAKDERAPTGYELQATNVVVTHSAVPFPIAKDNSTEWLLDIRHLSLRSRDLTAVAKVKATTLEGVREFFKKEGYWEVTPPIIVSGACEGGSTLFEFDYFGKKAFLSQSAQLYLEALIYSLEKVYAITPSFRAEKSRTVRHLAEYWHVEPEAAWLTHDELLELEENFVSHICHKVASERTKELRLLGREPKDLQKIEPPFERLPYVEAIAEVTRKGTEMEWGDDFGADEEKLLTGERVAPIFVTNFPKEVKAFYMKENETDPRTVLNNDCLAPEGYGEIIGGSQREDSVENLITRLKAQGQNPKDYEWYLDLRRYGSVPHSGFGMGVERLVRWMCKLEHIRDTTPFPRTINRSYP